MNTSNTVPYKKCRKFHQDFISNNYLPIIIYAGNNVGMYMKYRMMQISNLNIY